MQSARGDPPAIVLTPQSVSAKAARALRAGAGAGAGAGARARAGATGASPRLCTGLRLLAGRASPAVAASSRLLCTDALTTPAESGKAVGSVERKPQLDSRAVSAFTGTPKELLDKRVVTIYQPAPGVQNASKGCWKISWDDENTQRWSNPLMGWTSTRDPFSNTPMTLEFHSAEDAIRFVQNNGWKYEVQEPVSQNLALVSKAPRSYANNFTWKGPKTRQSQCGAGNMQSFPELYEPPPPPPKK